MKQKLLEIKDLYIEFQSDGRTVKAVNGLNLDIDPSETVGLVGETGAGKTTTALSIMKLIQTPQGRYQNGTINFDGENLLEASEGRMRTIRGKQISMIFQDPMTSLNPVYTVGNQIAEVILQHEKTSKAEAYAKAKQALELVGISSTRIDEYPHQFSGGMKQRVCIAMALVSNPKLIIADEPTTALDVTIQAQVLNLIRSLKHELDTAMLLITHDLGIVAEVCDRVAIMYAGEIIEYGTLTEIFEHPVHPYTQGLFSSIPKLDEKVRRLTPIQGMMPDPANLPSGCAFAPRCTKADAACAADKPQHVSINQEHSVSCYHWQQESMLGKES